MSMQRPSDISVLNPVAVEGGVGPISVRKAHMPIAVSLRRMGSASLIIDLCDCVLLCLVFYFPIFGRILPDLDLKYSYIKYSMAALFAIVAVKVVMRHKWKLIRGPLRWFLLFNAYLAATMVIKGAFVAQSVDGAQRIAGMIMGVLVILFVVYSKGFGRNKNYFEILAVCLAICLVVQIGISTAESIQGQLFGQYEMGLPNIVKTDIESRDVLSIWGISQRSITGLNFPLTGLIGQHNLFGIMLACYNLFFLLVYEATRKKWILLVLTVIILGLIGNSTRSALVVTLVSDYLVINYVNKIPWPVKAAFYAAFALLGLSEGRKVLEYAGNADMETRLQLWKSLWDVHFPPANLWEALVGLDFTGIMSVRAAWTPTDPAGSVENEFFEIYFYSGIIGVAAFISCFGRLLMEYGRRIAKRRRVQSVFAMLVSIAILCLVMDQVISYFCYPVIMLTILCAVHYIRLGSGNSELSEMAKKV
jgi:hypothetical protein